MDTAVDWARLGRAVEFYKGHGFTYVEVPWAVSRTAIEVTCPNPQNAGEVMDLGCLVGSAEQSFIALMQLGALPPGKYVACTPCFRLGDTYDDLHAPYFMKVELFRNDVDSVDFGQMGAHQMADLATSFMNRDIGRNALGANVPHAVNKVVTPFGWDLEIDGVEVGSYGIRNHEDLWWVYGTGLAEPRFSAAAKRWLGERPHFAAGLSEGLLHGGGDASKVKVNVVSSFDRAPLQPPQLDQLLGQRQRRPGARA